MLDAFCKLLGIRQDQAEDALKSEKAAKLVLSRRSMLGVTAALTAGSLFSFPGVEVVEEVIARPRNMLTAFDALLKERYMDTALIDRLTLGPSPFFVSLVQKLESSEPPLVG